MVVCNGDNRKVLCPLNGLFGAVFQNIVEISIPNLKRPNRSSLSLLVLGKSFVLYLEEKNITECPDL